MSCLKCEHVIERSDIVHVVRTCDCGRELHVFEPGEHGRGIALRPGDRLVIPEGFIKLSLNPLQCSGRLARPAIHWLAHKLFVDGSSPDATGIWEGLAKVEAEMDRAVNAFPPIAGHNVNSPEGAERVASIMREHHETAEGYAYFVGQLLAIARDAREEGDIDRAVWSVSLSERLRCMKKFKEDLEEVVWMGHSVARLRDVLKTWEGHHSNGVEEFWQQEFTENSFVLSQIFAEPVVFLQGKAYIGGMKFDKSDARILDYLFAAESSREVILIEIKTPTMRLLSGEYRGHSLPSRELIGSVTQVTDYRIQLVQSLREIAAESGVSLRGFAPKCVVIAGNAGTELKDADARQSFDLYRATLRDVQVMTYDELFKKVAILANLFGLKYQKEATATS